MLENKEIKDDFWQKPWVICVFAMFCTLLWGSAAPAIKIGYEIFSVDSSDLATKMLFAGYRFLLSGIFILAIYSFRTKKVKYVAKGDFRPFLLIGCVTAVQYVCYYVGLTFTTGAKGSLFSSVNGFIIVLISPLIYKSEKYTINKILGCVVAVCGLVLITMDGGVQEFSGFTLKGEFLVCMASFFHAVTFYMTKAFAKTRSPEVIAGVQLFLGGTILFALGTAGGGELAFDSLSAVLVVLYLSTLSALAFMFWGILVAHNEISSVSMYNLFTPIFGTLLSGLILGETILTWQNISSLVLVSLGVWLVTKTFTKAKESDRIENR